MGKYRHTLSLLTAVSEQTKVMVHLDLCDTEHRPESSQQAAKNAETVRTITEVVKDKKSNPFHCKDRGLRNISTGNKAAREDLVRAHEISEALRARDMDSEKVAPVKLATFAAKTMSQLFCSVP